MFLPRPTCEALAAACPEVRVQRDAGHWYYLPTGMPHPVLVTAYGADDRPYLAWHTDRGDANALLAGPAVTREGLLWCPLLDELLDLALVYADRRGEDFGARRGEYNRVTLEVSEVRRLHALHGVWTPAPGKTRWVWRFAAFTTIGGPAAPSPEEALAGWLLHVGLRPSPLAERMGREPPPRPPS